jgi:putative hemolysin
MNFLLIIFLTLLNGVFAMSELALASSRKARLTAMAESGDKGARAALGLLDNPTQFLSSVQVGITSIGMLNGIIGEAAFSGDLSVLIQSLGASVRAADISATAVVVKSLPLLPSCLGTGAHCIGQLYPEPWRGRWRGPWCGWPASLPLSGCFHEYPCRASAAVDNAERADRRAVPPP